MSYSETFHASIPVSGTVTVNYPASQNGGSTTVSYYEDVPVKWTVFVNTTPFDDSVQRTELALDALAGSVVALNAAQVQSIRESSRKVADSLSGGFFGLIGKDLSENMVAKLNTMRSKLALLMQYSRDLLAKQERMDEDVARLQRHYYTVFHDLDEDLNHRVSMLDKPACSLGRKRRDELLLAPYLREAAFCVKELQEGDRAGNLLIRARTSRGVSSALSSLEGYVRKNLAYRETVSGVLEKQAANDETTEFVPVVYYDSEDPEHSGAHSVRCVTPRMPNARQIENNVLRHIHGVPDASWRALDRDELERIDRSFCNFVEADSLTDRDAGNDRLHQEILRLWSSHKHELMDIQER